MRDRRKTRRTRSYFGAQIEFNQRCSLMDCVVRNISGAGAKLVFTSTATVPQEFRLCIPTQNRTLRARIVWRDANGAGVTFSAMQPQAAEPAPLDLISRLKASEGERAVLRRPVEELASVE